MTTGNYKIFCDLDDTLVDFTSGIKMIYAKYCPDVEHSTEEHILKLIMKVDH